MNDQSLTIAFVPAPAKSAADGPWLTLEQEYIPETSQNATLADITAMWHIAMTGDSAFNYIASHCPVSIRNGVVTVYLGVYVYPSAQDLAYKISISTGIFRTMKLKTLTKNFDLLIPQSASVSLDFVPEDDLTYEWETDAYNAFGEQIPKPEITIKKNVVTLSESCFGVLRCKCTTIAQYYPIEISVVKSKVAEPTQEEIDAQDKKIAACVDKCEAAYGTSSPKQNDNLYFPCVANCKNIVKQNTPPKRTALKITNLQATVQATWMGSDGKVANKSLSLKIPGCVKHLLEMCDNDKPKNSRIRLNDEPDPIAIVYFSTCTGNVLEVQFE
jgi:hypothetical protein